MEGERTFDDTKIELPKDCSNEVWEFLAKYEDDEEVKLEMKKEIGNYFRELLSFQRAVFMIETEVPLDVSHRIEYLLVETGYKVYNHIDFCLAYDDIRKEQIPGKPEPGNWIYVSLRDEFIELAKLSAIGIGGAALEGLLFGYNARNIIAYIDEPDPSPEEIKEYLDGFSP